jgi:riboflavin synthase alpha subunit
MGPLAPLKSQQSDSSHSNYQLTKTVEEGQSCCSNGVCFIRELLHKFACIEVHLLNAADAAGLQPANNYATINCDRNVSCCFALDIF